MNTNILIAKNYGSSSVLEFLDQPLPALAAGFARIQVKAAGINPIDARRMTGEFRHGILPQTFGTEFAGEIIAVSPEISHWKIGDQVLGSGGAYTHATIIDVPLENLIAKPATIDWATAGTLAGVSQTAMTILDELGPIESLLIHGASGGVGSITIQIAKERGITVVATASSKNQQYLQELGAQAVVYGPGLVERIQEIHPRLFDASVDMSGTEEATQAALQLVKPQGLRTTIAGKKISSPRIQAIWVKRNPENLKYVVERIADNRYKWQIDQKYPFKQAADAYDHILKGHTRGKNVLIF